MMQAAADVPVTLHPKSFWIRGSAPEPGETEIVERPTSPTRQAQAASALKPPDSYIGWLAKSPEVHLPSHPNPLHRVIQVCVGAEHGVLLADSGTVFTWGDNRYGQLGRDCVLKEEDERPFPVLVLSDEEVVQVACGRHHCLALTVIWAPKDDQGGTVWAWGRNKAGQCGVGDTRDRPRPAAVPFVDESKPGAGAVPMVTICAGANSSLAAAPNADIWQWGQISAEFKDERPAKEQRSITKTKPYKVLEQRGYRSGSRGVVPMSLSDCGCNVLKELDEEKRTLLKDAVDTLRNHQKYLGQARNEAREFSKDRKVAAGTEIATPEKSSESNLKHLQDTIATLTRQEAQVDREIELYKKNMESCDQHLKHIKSQTDRLAQQAQRLQKSQDDLSLQRYEMRKRGAEWKKLQEKLQEIQEFAKANQNTRTSLFGQNDETDKERTKLKKLLDTKKEEKKNLQTRLKIVNERRSAAS
eukprot:NODE_2337_length_2233_cov_4.053656.p1 GENE.NODE_2337_length_2233_cov_4.053656~~NODE_2337_length_2233_cov_4.053656.p1  ORF type:complete len:471 (-),score=146.02 NODE_2337_length_2233_cov_4.053656:667-2079(-)